jgi:branched-chain amino acid transport system ATP-binding protein
VNATANTAVPLQTRGLTVRFGGLTAVHDVDVDCVGGQLTGLIGPNGAGKTTFIDAVTGFLPNNATGQVLLDGIDVLGASPHRIAHSGLTRTWQTLELFDDITVRSNLDVAVERLTFANALRDYFRPGRRGERVDEVLAQLEMEHISDRKPRELSQGQRKMVGVARAMVAESRVLLLDEPAAGLDKNETVWFGDQLRRLVDQGQTMLLVDHDMSLVLTVCDRIHTVVFGELIASGTPAETRANPDVISAYLGGTS